MTQSPLKRLGELGQSVWLDFISRELVTGDSLRTLIEQKNVTGMTSNPTIFEKAIAEGRDYDDQLRTLTNAGVTSPDDLFFDIAISDIQRAADTLRPVWERTGGADGYVSIEVAPGIAHDTDATVAAAQGLWSRIERPNLMVKIPATPAGIPAIERSIAAGINVNVTLIFALAAYDQVARAYLGGLRRRDAEGMSLDVHSVASFFVSRVDTAVDKLLEARLEQEPDNQELRSLLGKAGIANSKLAYERFEQIFEGEDFRGLRERGAHVQRMLWASTSAKNPAYRDVYIAEALIGPETIDTMPPAVVDAFDDHGIADAVTVNQGYAEAHEVIDRLRSHGIDIDQVTEQLLNDGVASFAKSYNQLITVIAEKTDRFRGGLGHRQHLDVGAQAEPVEREVASAAQVGMVQRIWDRDPDLWKPGDAEHAAVIRNRLGWLDVAGRMRDEAASLMAFGREVRDEGTRDAVLLGMGGSSLCPEVLRTSFGSQAGHPTLHVLDTTDPAAILALSERLDLRRTLFVVSSKSGGTVETLSHLAHFWEAVRAAGVPEPGSRFVAVTDPGTSLASLARERAFRRVFENPPDIGGRYSAMSYFGMVPAALMGLDVAQLCSRAVTMSQQCSPGTFPTLNCGLTLGSVMGLLWGAGRDKVTILAPPRIAAFSLWAEQLLAESTGKEGRGIVPIGAEPVGEPGVYGDDRLFVVLRLGEDAAFDSAVGALRSAGQPVVTLEMADLYDLAGEFFRWEFATAVAATHLHIDPFDEPNVTESKENTKRLLAMFDTEGALPREDAPTASRGAVSVLGGEPASDPAAALRAHLDGAQAGDYVALQAYVTPDDATTNALQELRVAIRDSRRLATTLGFGPRFLHSTGQLHKGGPNTGVFVQVTGDDQADVPIPGQRYSFSVLKQAQADGDLESLRSHERRVIRIHAGGGPEKLREALAELTGAVRAAPVAR